MGLFYEVMSEFARQHPWIMVLNVCMMGFAPIADVYLPYLYGRLIDAVEKQKTTTSIFTWIVAMLIVVQLGNFMRDLLDRSILPAFETITRDIIIKKILDKFEGNYMDINSGEVISKIMKTPGTIKEWFKIFNDWLIPFLFVLISSVIYLYFIDALLALLLVIFIAFLTYFFIKFPPNCTDKSLNSYNAYNSLSEQFDEVFRNLSSVYSCNQKDEERVRMREKSKNFAKEYSKMINCTIFYKSLSVPLLPFFLILFVLRSLYLVKSKKMTSSNFSSIFMVAISIIGNASWILVLMRPRAYDLGAMKSINEFLEFDIHKKNQRDDNSLSLHLPLTHDSENYNPNLKISLINVSFKRGEHQVFDGRTVHFETGQTTLIYGDVGSGKSTMLKLIMGFYTVDGGEIYIDGRPFSELTKRQIRQKIGYVPQDPVLFNRPLIDNVLYGSERREGEREREREREKRQATIELIKSLGVYNEESIEAPVGKNGSNLSGGQRQLAWCLRVLLKDHDVILMDEPTSSMDEPTKLILVQLLNTYAAHKTVIIVSHDDFMKKVASRYLLLRIH
jgi:ABC-type multidrug transport system fused ATPase/permease subunit